MFGVLFNLLALVRTRHFCIHMQAMLSQATLHVSPTRMAVVTPTDRPKSARNRCVFGGVVVFSRCFLDFSVGVDAFVMGLIQISSFFSHNRYGHI